MPLENEIQPEEFTTPEMPRRVINMPPSQELIYHRVKIAEQHGNVPVIRYLEATENVVQEVEPLGDGLDF